MNTTTLRNVIIVMGIINIIRMTIYLLGSDAYTLRNIVKNRKNRKSYYRPKVSVIVPAHNEAAVIEKTLEALHKSNYPKSRLEIIVANDGSTDNTALIVKDFITHLEREEARAQNSDKAKYRRLHFKTRMMSQPNRGKADVLNNAIKRYATGRLVICLDADSLIAPDGIKNAVQYFRNRSVVMLASNVNIIEDGSLLSLAQRFEYLVSYHMKKAQTALNTEYIIGGIGSMFRCSMLHKVNYYDTNTMTEDIDLTMKVIVQGNRKNRVVYASDCITYTQAVPTFKSLISQRFRWKYGRMQTFLKHPQLFFNSNKKYAKQLTWLVLPLAVLQETMFLFEPLFVGFIFYNSIRFHDPTTMIAACLVLTIYISLNIWSSEHLSIRERIRLTVLAPAMYVLLYVMSVVEYAALLKAVSKLHRLRASINGRQTTWISPERSTAST